MSTRRWVRGYRISFALLALAAMGTLLIRGVGGPGFSVSNFFSFFTIQSNLFAVAVLLWGASLDQERRNAATVDLIRGAAVCYLAIVGVVYGLLLSGYTEALETTIPWCDSVVHRIIPIVMVVDWLIVPPTTRLTMHRALIWLAVPALYAVYSLIRGPIVDWYPYYFLDPNHRGGYAAVAFYCLGIGAVTVLFAWLVVTLGNRLRFSVAPS